MKRRFLVAVLLLAMVSVFSISAQSNGRNGGGFFGGGQGNGPNQVETEEVVISGSILLEEDKLPLLKNKGVDYVVMIPPFLAREIGLNNGDKVEVEGLAGESMVSGMEFKIVRPRIITINGETFNLFNKRHEMRDRSNDDCRDDCDKGGRNNDRKGSGKRNDKNDRRGPGKNW